jgi:hypothetical protein
LVIIPGCLIFLLVIPEGDLRLNQGAGTQPPRRALLGCPILDARNNTFIRYKSPHATLPPEVVMATQTALSADVSAAPEIAASSRRYPNLRKSFGPLALFAAAAIVEALIPKLRILLVQLPYFVVAALVKVVFRYLRDLHPTRVPAPFTPDAPLLKDLLRLQRILLAISVFSPLLLIAAMAGAFDKLFGAPCLCENHLPLLLWLFGTPCVLAALGHVGIGTYIRERSIQ